MNIDLANKIQPGLADAGNTVNSNFEELYLDIRDKEKRVYTDAELISLPDINESHIHIKEWKIRKVTSDRIVTYLKKKNRPLKILEIGCGNGWLSAKLSDIKHSHVTGLDINNLELNQAKRVFKKDNLQFVFRTLENQVLENIKFDIIVFAASVQYFSSLEYAINLTLNILEQNGEIHLMDTSFYKEDEVDGAVKRTKDYYNSLGFLEMSAYYFHHQFTQLNSFNYKVLANPTSLFNRLVNKNPFYWIKITH